jgi:hypothetical protein
MLNGLEVRIRLDLRVVTVVDALVCLFFGILWYTGVHQGH